MAMALPAAVVLVWLFVGGPLGSFTGRLAEVQSNDNATFLPSDAESTRVTELQERFQEQATFPAIIVWENVDGIEPATQQAATEDVQAIASIRSHQGADASYPVGGRSGAAVHRAVGRQSR